MQIIIENDPERTSYTDVREKRDFPPAFNTVNMHFLGSKSKNQNSANNIFQRLLHSPCTCKNFWIKPFPGKSKLTIYITHTEILLS